MLAALTMGADAAESAADSAPAASAAAPELSSPSDGAKLASPITVRFRVPMTASSMAMGSNEPTGGMPAGHAHLFIDSPPPEADAHVPMDERHKHLMHGEKSMQLDLAPGKHTLQLVLASSGHQIGNPPIASPRITIEILPKPTPSP